MANVYTPMRHGAVQTAYYDQMATAAPGMLANASDSNLVDAALVGGVGENGLEAGLAVVLKPVPAVVRSGLNQYAATLPVGASGDDIGGVAVRNLQMRSNASGEPCWFEREICNVARVGRNGARIWVRLADGATPVPDDAVFVLTGADNAGKFTAASGAGAVAVTSMIFRSAAENGLALVELL